MKKKEIEHDNICTLFSYSFCLHTNHLHRTDTRDLDI